MAGLKKEKCVKEKALNEIHEAQRAFWEKRCLQPEKIIFQNRKFIIHRTRTSKDKLSVGLISEIRDNKDA